MIEINGEGRSMKRILCCLFCILLILPLVIGITPSLQWGDTPLKMNLPPIVITGKSTFKIIESRQIPVPSPFLPGSKERPQIVVTSTSAPEVSGEGKRQPVPKSPGCTYRNAITTKVATIFKKDKAYDQRGKYLFLQRRYPEAIDTFRRLIGTYPDSRLIGEAYFWIGECYFQLDDLIQAETYFKTTFKKYPSSKYADYAVYSLGWIYYKKKAYPSAIRYLKQGSLSYPNSPIFSHMLFWLAESYMQSKDLDRAGLTFSRFLKKSPPPTLKIPALYEMARISFYKGEYRDAKKILSDLSGMKLPGRLLPKVRVLSGWCEYFLNEPQGLETFEAVLSTPNLSPELKGEALYGKGLSALQERQPKVAEACLDKLGPASPWFGELAIELANYYFNLKDYKTSGNFCAKIFQSYAKSPYLEKAYFILGNGAYNMRDYSHATEYYTRVIMGKVKTLRPMAIFAKGLSFYQMGLFKDAIDSWEILLRKYPKFPRRGEAIYWVGSAYLNLHKEKLAIQSFRQLRDDSILYSKALMQLAQYYFGQQSWQNSLGVLRRFLKRFPRHEYSGYAMGMMGEIYFNLKSYQKATQWILRALKSPASASDRSFKPKLEFILGQIAYRKGDFKQAIGYFGRVAEKYPRNAYSAQAYYWKSMSYFSLRNFGDAITSFKAFIRKFPDNPKVPDAYLKIADCYYNLKNYGLSDLYYRKVSGLRKNKNVREKAAYGRILSLYQEGNYSAFYREAKRFIDHYPNSSLILDVIQLLAEYYDREGDTGKEIDLLEGFVKSHRNAEQVDAIRFKLAKLYEKKGLYNSALIQLRLISQKKHGPFLSVAEKEMGDLYYKQGLYREAVIHYRKYLRSEKLPATIVKEVKRKLVTCLIVMASFNEAEKELKAGTKAYGIDWAAPLYLKLGEAFQRRKKYRSALAAFKNAQKSSISDVKCTSMIRVSEVYARQKRYDKALKMLLTVRYSYPKCRKSSEKALLKLAVILGKKGRKDEARQLLKALAKSHDKEIKRLAQKALNRLH